MDLGSAPSPPCPHPGPHPPPCTLELFPLQFLIPVTVPLESLKRLWFQFRLLDLLPSLWKLQATWLEGIAGDLSVKPSALFPGPCNSQGPEGFRAAEGSQEAGYLRSSRERLPPMA